MGSLEPLARLVAASWGTSTSADGLAPALGKLFPGLTYARWVCGGCSPAWGAARAAA